MFLPLSLLMISTGFNFINTSTFIMVKAQDLNPYLSDLIYEENVDDTLTVIGVNESSINKNNLRIYGYHETLNKEITKISSNAFIAVSNLSSLMISNNIEVIENNALNISSLTTINYTGSIDEWNQLNYDTSIQVIDYSFDEGFINYWNKYIRPTKNSSVCDISKERYSELKFKYNSLGSLDRNNVNEYIDIAGESIEDSLHYLENYFNPKEEQPKENKISKDVAMTIVIGIAIFGMTSIAVFYLLMKKNIIS